MFNPKYQVLLTSKCFPQDKVVGLGSQLISIVNFIKDSLPPHIWYGANIDAVGVGARKYNTNSNKFQPNLIGSDLQFVDDCSKIDQFIWGVFLCIDSSFSSQSLQDVELGAEDEPFRSINCKGVLMEIRAFDTSYFEIYSENLELIDKLAKAYRVEIEKS
jgi:hypothetical protein